ncbi:MAG: hypothetical protein ACI8RD_007603, partial [Bacillariaceae sp.]
EAHELALLCIGFYPSRITLDMGLILHFSRNPNLQISCIFLRV